MLKNTSNNTNNNFNELIDLNCIRYTPIYKTINLMYYTDNKVAGSPLSRVGDAYFQYKYNTEPNIDPDEDLKKNIKKAVSFCKYSINKIMRKMKEINNKNTNLIYLPSPKNAIFINSKIDYLEILYDLIDTDTLLLRPPPKININKVIEYKNNFEEGNKVYPLEKLCIIKTPYAGGSSCIIDVPNQEVNKSKPYEYWLGIFIKQSERKYKNSEYKKIKCSGFSTGLIIQNYNDHFDNIGEFRCFCVNGIIVAIVHSNEETGFNLIANRKNLFDKNDDLKIEDLGELEICSEQNIFDNLKQYILKFEEICYIVRDRFKSIGQPLDINRIDLIISSDSTLEDPKFIVNEVEDFSCGPTSTRSVNVLVNNQETYLMFRFKKILAKLYYNSLHSFYI